MVVTNQFGLTSKEYFIMLITIFLKKKWWIMLLLIFIDIPLMLEGNYFALVILIYPVVAFIQLWSYAYSKENNIIFKQRYFEIDSNKMTGFIEGGSQSVIMIADFKKVKQTKKYYLLYLAKNQMISFPKNAFQSPVDEIWFKNNIVECIKENK